MFVVTVSKNELLAVLEQNRADHREVFLKAQERYRAAVVAELDRRLQVAREHPEQLDLQFNGFIAPKDHTDDYDRVIGMVNMSTTDTIELGEDEHRQYVLDQWSWARQWYATSNAYMSDDELADYGYTSSGKFARRRNY